VDWIPPLTMTGGSRPGDPSGIDGPAQHSPTATALTFAICAIQSLDDVDSVGGRIRDDGLDCTLVERDF